MPIPDFSRDGLLPVGVHDCTLADIRQRLGSFHGSDRRPQLFARLAQLVEEARQAELFESVLVDGSFVTDKPAPNDIDLVLVFRRGLDFQTDLRPSQYRLVSPGGVRRRFGFDVVFAEAHSEGYADAAEFFQQVRNEPGKRKGILKLKL